jgi:hypothetical protein
VKSPDSSEVIGTGSTPTNAAVRSQPVVYVPKKAQPIQEIGGRKDGTEPTRFGDWEKNGRCIDF